MELPPAFHAALAGRYEIEGLIGQGGMAAVFLARDLKHGRQVAVKVLKPALGSVLGAERFLTEIRVTAHLQHPHLLPLFDSGEAAGLLYYVMPYVRGESLRARLTRERQLPIDDAIRLVMVVAAALEHAHGQGIVHRDLKPENVLLQDGQPIVADFGIALALSEAADARVTQTGMVLGTPYYMSPEQAAGERNIDARTDVYALGAMLYEMVAGRPPFVADSAQSVVAKILTERPVTLRSLRHELTPAVDLIVMRALARNPADRWSRAEDFRQALIGARPAGGSTESGAGIADSESLTQSVSPVRRRPPVLAVAAVVGVVVLIAGTLWYQSRGDAPAPSSSAAGDTRPRSLAVLPFENRSADPSDEYFSDGLTEELLHQLAQTRDIRVAARTSSFAFKGQPVDREAISKRLDVEAIVSGSVRRSGSAVRITAQLVRVADGRLIWSQQYEREMSDAFRVQDEIARAIVARVGADPAATSVAAPAPSPAVSDGPGAEAFDLYLRGLYQWNRRTEEGARASVDLFSKAVAKAPSYARAHGSLAEAYAVLGFYGYMPPREAFAKARAGARHTLTLDPTSPEARSTLAYVALYHDWDVAAAEKEFRQAIAENPHFAVAQQWYANALTVAGRFQEAEAAMKRAQTLDPLAPVTHAALGWAYLYAGDFAAAEKQLRTTLVSFPDYFLALLWLGDALESQGRHQEALQIIDRARRVAAGNVSAETARLRVLAASGRAGEARAGLARLQQLEQSRYVSAYPRALVLLALGDRDGAFALLNRAVEDREHSIALLPVDPKLNPLRSDPRFARLVAAAAAR